MEGIQPPRMVILLYLFPCPEGYGALLGPAVLYALFTLIGASLIQTGLEGCAGMSGTWYALCTFVPFVLPSPISMSRPHREITCCALQIQFPMRSAEFIGLNFSVFLIIILCERLGSLIMKSTLVVVGLLTGCIIAAACDYFDRPSIDSASAVSFIWVETFPLAYTVH
jgi:xanthine/uracil permease